MFDARKAAPPHPASAALAHPWAALRSWDAGKLGHVILTSGRSPSPTAGSGCSVESQGATASAPATPVAAIETRVEKVTNIRVQEVALETVKETFTLPGSLEAWEDITLGLEQAGPIRWIGPREGQRLAQGDPILRVDPDTLESQHRASQVDHDLAERQLRRMETLVDKQLVSELEFDQAREAFELAKSRLRQSALALEKSTLVSPIDGVLDVLLVDRGEFGSVGTPAAVVVRVDLLKVLVDVPEKDVSALRVGGTARITLTASAGDRPRTVDGTIEHVAYRADPASRTYQAKVAVANPSGALRPGMIVRVEFDRKLHRRVVTVPLYSLVDRDGHKELYVEQDGVALRRAVVTGPVVDDQVVIHDGIEPGERLIVSGQQLVRDGARSTWWTARGSWVARKPGI